MEFLWNDQQTYFKVVIPATTFSTFQAADVALEIKTNS